MIDDLHFSSSGCSKSKITLKNREIKTYPNPFENEFTVKTEIKGGKTVTVYSSDGRTLYRNVFQSKEFSVELNDAERGTYYVKINERIVPVIKK
ncbi:MAG: T9SS type A sorting domain-containing protein [Bacteroidota bacterium]